MSNFYQEKQEIKKWLYVHKIYDGLHNISEIKIVEDEKYGFVVNVCGNVRLNNKDLKFIPVKFGKIEGDFNCMNNQLTSLEFCPEEVTKSFNCSNNKLSSLEFSPEKVGTDFNCAQNKLISLEFSPPVINGNFNCECNQLTDLKHCPVLIDKDFNFSDNKVKTVEYFPQEIKGQVYSYSNGDLKNIQKVSKSEIFDEHFKVVDIIQLNDKLDNCLPTAPSTVKKNNI